MNVGNAWKFAWSGMKNLIEKLWNYLKPGGLE